MGNRICKKNGFTLVETLIAASISIMILGSLAAAYLAAQSINQLALHRMQAMQVVRSQIELLKATSYAAVADSTQTNVAFSAGKDGVFNTTDDFKGTLTVSVADWLDMDNDCATNPTTCRTESAIDLDEDGVNDTGFAKPVRVTFQWTEKLLGQRKTFTVSVDTLIAA